jgi:L-lactate dehydrogenase complex protein LldE
MKRISLFIPCAVNLLLPEVAEATETLVRRLDCIPVYHDTQTCCGQMVFNTGFTDQARTFARHFITVFENDDAVVSPSGSCTFMVRQNYPVLFESEPRWKKRAEALAARVFELTEFIVDVMGRTDVGAGFDGTVAYHESCHLKRGLGISEQPKALIGGSPGTRLTVMNQADQCCGFGGEFAVSFSDISGAMVAAKAKNYLDSGADLLVIAEPGCLLNVRGYLEKHHPEKAAVHIAEFLAGNGAAHGR